MRSTEETVQALFKTLAQRFTAQQDPLNELGSSVAKPGYGVTLAQAFVAAEKGVRSSDETKFGELLTNGARALKTDAEPLLPFLLFEIGKASALEDTLTLSSFREGLKNAVMSTVRVGQVRYGQGSLLDALIPASETAHAADTLTLALTGAAGAASGAAQRTGHPGMAAVALMLGSLAETYAESA